ncbi:MAG: hypothetical protein SPH79_06945 [Schaalia hyovaginalis]|uniref:hypothetical protein n=1 Tax=Schaalia hyovaginalis TaxID=29316 RepID=UPI002A90FA29|nr:hypothetical protein [Schaalia hyovaginalis]MDY6214212.1 hypothetical protein [Schaalia hyovaginalis]
MRSCVDHEKFSDVISVAVGILIPVGIVFYSHPPYAYIYVLRFTFLMGSITLIIALPILQRARVFRHFSWNRDGEVMYLSEPRLLLVIRIVYILLAFITVLSTFIPVIIYRLPSLFVISAIFCYSFARDGVLYLRGFFTAPYRAFVALDVEGFTVRRVDGRVSTFAWEDSPRVLGVSRRGRLVLTASRSGPSEVDFASLPIKYSAIERIINYYVEHKEARAALGSEEGLRQIERLCR